MFEVSRNKEGIDIQFSSTLENVDRAAEETRVLISGLGLEGQSFGLMLAIREALINSVRHGCGLDEDKTVSYSFHVKDDYAIVSVEDDGEGFDWKSVLDGPPPTTWDHGRGVPIMRKYCTHMEYNDKGNLLVMKNKINAGGCYE